MFNNEFMSLNKVYQILNEIENQKNGEFLFVEENILNNPNCLKTSPETVLIQFKNNNLINIYLITDHDRELGLIFEVDRLSSMKKEKILFISKTGEFILLGVNNEGENILMIFNEYNIDFPVFNLDGWVLYNDPEFISVETQLYLLNNRESVKKEIQNPF